MEIHNAFRNVSDTGCSCDTLEYQLTQVSEVVKLTFMCLCYLPVLHPPLPHFCAHLPCLFLCL